MQVNKSKIVWQVATPQYIRTLYLFVFIDFIDLCSLLYPFPLSKFGGRKANFYTMKFGGKIDPLAVFALQVRVKLTVRDSYHNE